MINFIIWCIFIVVALPFLLYIGSILLVLIGGICVLVLDTILNLFGIK